MLESKRVLLDCRWLGLGGAGRATELLLRGLTELRPPGRWILWGPADVATFAWHGAVHVLSRAAPKALGGQRALGSVPTNDVAIYLHQIRPLGPGSSVTVIHDTIPLRHGGSAANRLAKRLFYRAAAARSTRIVTVSEYSRRSIERDLGVRTNRISVVSYPVDERLRDRVLALRAALPAQPTALYVGSFARHKNLERLLLAFAETSFRREGGILLLTGGEAQRVDELRTFARAHGVSSVRIEGPTPQARLEELYATSRMLVQPSLEEGFGLPVWEAMTCGLAVCASDAGSLPEVTRGLARTFSPTSVPELAEAIDDAAGDARADVDGPLTAGAPSVEEFAQRFVDVAEAAGR